MNCQTQIKCAYLSNRKIKDVAEKVKGVHRKSHRKAKGEKSEYDFVSSEKSKEH